MISLGKRSRGKTALVVKITLEDLTECRFWRTAGGEQHDNWIWWEKPDKAEYNFDTVEDLGIGWIYYIGEINRT